MEEIETVDEVDAVCQHPRLSYSKIVVNTGTTDTCALRVSGFFCQDCNTKFLAKGPSGWHDFAVLPLVSAERVATMAQAPQSKPVTKPVARTEPIAQTPEQRVAAAEAKIVADIGGDGPGTRLALGFFRKGYHKSCQACTDLAKRMNEWGTDGCRERLDAIVDDILPRARKWVSDTHRFASGVLGLVGAVVDVETPLLKTGIRSAVVEAIDDWDQFNQES